MHPLDVRCHLDGWRQLVTVVEFDVLGVAGIEQDSGDRSEFRGCGCVGVTDTEPISLSSPALQWTVAANSTADVPCSPVWIPCSTVSDTSPSEEPPTFRVAPRVGRAVGDQVLIEAIKNRVGFRTSEELRRSRRGRRVRVRRRKGVNVRSISSLCL